MDIVLVFFIYGLTFFSMGLVTALEAGRSPMLAEARILRPLAVFGLLHGMHEWLEIFIIQTERLGEPAFVLWLWLRLALLAVSFVSLVAFGIQSLKPPKKVFAMDAWIGGGLLILYIAIVMLTGSIYWQSSEIWIIQADILARYILAIPGALLAFISLRRQAQQAKRDHRNKLSNYLHWAAFGFIFYGLTQIFVPQGNMFPANLVNAQFLIDYVGIPIQVVRAGIAIIITIGLIQATQFVEKERQEKLLAAEVARFEALQQVQDELVKREEMRRDLLRHTVNAQEEERARIASELHDETAQILTGFTLDLAALRSYLPKEKEVTKIMDRLQALSHQISRNLHRLVHDLRPAQLDDLGLIPALQHLIEEFECRMNLEVSLAVEGEKQRLDAVIETVFFRVIQEGLTNIVRHAKTKQSSIRLCFSNDQIDLWITDQGVGFVPDENDSEMTSFGIAGMRERVRSIGGEFQIHSSPMEGTSIEVTVPLSTAMQIPDEECDNGKY